MNLTPLMSNDATAVGGDASAPNRTVAVATQRSEVNSTTTVESQGDRSVVLTLSRAAEASAEADPVGRAQKIATLTSLVREGKYTVSSIDIAESMIRKGVLEGVDTPFVV